MANDALSKLVVVNNTNANQYVNDMPVNYGILPILATFTEFARSNKARSINWSLYLINVETIIRDRKSKNANVMTAENIKFDCTVIAQYIAMYNSICMLKEKPLIVFYLPKYEMLPKEVLRDKLPKGTEERWKLRNEVQKELESNGFLDNYEGTEIAFCNAEPSKTRFPHKALIMDLMKSYSGISMRRTLMISHVPLDFHLYRIFKNFMLLESYTGKIKGPKEFGRKVFKNEKIPFNKYTHLLLGDKWYMRQQVDLRTKRAISDLAAKDRWNILPDLQILESLVSKGYISDSLVKMDI